MKKAEELKVLNFKGVPYIVDNMSPAIKDLVDVYNRWAQVEFEAYDQYQMAAAAKNNLANQIASQMQKEQEEAAKKVAAEEAAKKATEAPTPDTQDVVKEGVVE